jgi:DNA-binding MarR family transcriptional regulator
MQEPDHVGRVMDQWARERPDLDVSPQAVIARLHRLAATLYVELDVVYSEFGLKDGEFDVLATLRRAGEPYELTTSQLGTTTMISSGAVTKRVDRLCGAGLVTRRVNEVDARGRLVALTPAGLTLIDRAFEAHIANEHRLVDLLDPDERQQLAALLETWGRRLGG